MPSPLLNSTTSLGSATPIWHRETCHLFVRMPTAIAHFTSTNLVTWLEAPHALQFEGKADAESLASPCSIVEHGGQFYLFYSQAGQMHLATSRDLTTWKPHAGNPVLKDNGIFYRDDPFADPCVLYHAGEAQWWMLFSGRVPTQPLQRAGCVGLATSGDLIHWELHSPLWMPGSEAVCQAPQLVEVSRGRWYLLYRNRQLQVRVANEARGPFRCPPVHHLLDGNTGGGTRPLKTDEGWLLFPYLPDGEHAKQSVLGTPRLLRTELDASVSEQAAPQLRQAWREQGVPIELLLGCRYPLGRWEHPEPTRHVSTTQGGGVIMLPQLHGDFHAEMDLTVTNQDTDIRLLVRTDDELTGGLELTIEPRAQLLTLRAVNDDDSAPLQAVRYTPMTVKRPLHVELVVHGGHVEAFIGDRVSLSGRLEGKPQGKVAVEFRGGTGELNLMGARQLHQVLQASPAAK